MSLWTPGGEHPVDRDGDAGGAPGSGSSGGPGGVGGPQLTAEQQLEAEQIATEMAEVRAQLAQVPAAQVVANHAMGCWELAAIHLSNQPPRFEEAQVAIDAFGALVEVLDGKLGADEATLRDALAQLRLAFVQVKASYEAAGPGDQASGTTDTDDPGDD
jgi:hypothetical protein